jgi:hypothetical protein
MEHKTRTGTAFGGNLIEHRGRQEPEAVFTYRPLAGAQQNNRGNARTVTLPTFAGGSGQFVPSIVETPKNSGDDAEVVTITLSVDLPQSLFQGGDHAGAKFDIVGVIEWGVGGSFYTAEIDWNQGVAFAVCANVVRISARISSLVAIGIPDVDITLHASMAYGNANSPTVSSSIRRTLDFGSVGPGADSIVLAIPPWALGFTICDAGLVGGTTPEPDYDIFLLSSFIGPTVVAVYKLLTRSNLGSQLEGQFPIPLRARFLRVHNNLSFATNNTHVVFNLGL